MFLEIFVFYLFFKRVSHFLLYYYLFLGWILRFVCGRELLGKSVKLSIKNAGTIHIFPELRNLAEMDEKNHFDYYCNNFGAFS